VLLQYQMPILETEVAFPLEVRSQTLSPIRFLSAILLSGWYQIAVSLIWFLLSALGIDSSIITIQTTTQWETLNQINNNKAFKS